MWYKLDAVENIKCNIHQAKENIKCNCFQFDLSFFFIEKVSMYHASS